MATTPRTKKCDNCGTQKEVTEFRIDGRTVDGLARDCNACKGGCPPHHWIESDETVEKTWPGFFNHYDRSPAGYGWSVCYKCGTQRQIRISPLSDLELEVVAADREKHAAEQNGNGHGGPAVAVLATLEPYDEAKDDGMIEAGPDYVDTGDLLEELENLRGAHGEVITEVRGLRDIVADQTSQLQLVGQAADAYEQQVREMQEKILHLARLADEQTARAVRVEDMLTKANAEADEWMRKHNIQADRADELEHKNKGLEGDLWKQAEIIRNLDADKAKAQALAADRLRQYTDSEVTNRNLIEQLHNERAETDKLALAHKTELERANNLQKAYEELNGRHLTLGRNYDEAREFLDIARDQNETLGEQLGLLQKKLTKAEALIETQRGIIFDTRRELGARVRQVRLLEISIEITELERERDELEAQDDAEVLEYYAEREAAQAEGAAAAAPPQEADVDPAR